MGKKAKFKKIRRIAAQMPVIEAHRIVGTRVSGVEVLEEGIDKVDGKEVKPDGVYSKKSVATVPLNHSRNMKKIYNKHGIAGVNGYIGSVNQYIAAQKEAQAKAEAEKAAEEQETTN